MNQPKIYNITKDDVLRLKMVKKLNPKFDTMANEALYKLLDARYPNRGTLSVISYSLKKAFTLDGDHDKANYWNDKGASLSKEVHNQEMESELTGREKQNWKTQEQILEIIKDLQSNMKTKTQYNRYLVLCLCVYQPPLRRGIYTTLKFLFNIKHDNKKDNYVLLLNKPVNKAYYIINNDKVSKYETFTKDENKCIEIENKDLVQLLWNSYNRNKREYVFTDGNNKPYNESTIRILLEPLKLTFNILRSSYISQYYMNNQFLKERTELARKMRHSVDIAQLKYQKRMPKEEISISKEEEKEENKQ